MNNLPDRQKCFEAGWIFPGYLSVSEPRSIWELIKDISMEKLRRQEIAICTKTLSQVFINPTFALLQVTKEWSTSNDKSAILQKAFYGLPAYCFDWF